MRQQRRLFKGRDRKVGWFRRLHTRCSSCLGTWNHSNGIGNSGQPECGSRRLVTGSFDPDGVRVAHGRIPAADECVGYSALRFASDAPELQGQYFIKPFNHTEAVAMEAFTVDWDRFICFRHTCSCQSLSKA